MRDRLVDYMNDNRYTVKEMAEELNVSRSYLSEYLNGKVRSEKIGEKVEAAVRDFFESDDEKSASFTQSNRAKAPEQLRKRGILHTDDLNGIIYVCKTCQDKGGLGVITGKPGGGKTYSLRHYSKLPKTVYIECNDTMNTRDLIQKIRRAFGLDEKRSGSINDAIEEICEFCNDNPGYVLMIDEADKMLTRFTQKKMEIIRSLYDNAELAIVLAGEPSLEGDIKKYVARMADRMDWTYRLHGLSRDEAEEYVSDRLNIGDGAMSELIARATNSRNGSFRRLNRIVENLAAVYGDEEISEDMVSDVARMMF